jgi:hypothetical protein
MSTLNSSAETRTHSVAPLAIATTLIAAAGTVYGAHDWREIIVVLPVMAVAAALVFGLVVPRALRKESAGGTALGLAIPAVLLTLPAFWSGLPLILGVGGFVVGHAGRNARTGSGKCLTAVVLSALAVLGYLAIYITDGMIGGNAGFLFD